MMDAEGGRGMDLGGVRVDPQTALRIPRALALRKGVLALAAVGGKVHAAAARAPDEGTRRAVAQIFRPQEVEWHVAEGGALRRLLQRVYGTGGAETGGEDPVAAAEEIFRAARLRGASDIHVNPTAEGVRVVFRVDGVLEEYRRYGSGERTALTNRLKVMAGLDIAERRAAQDGGFSLPPLPEEPKSRTDVRVATLPVRHGEKVTLRLLAGDREELTLERLGMRAEHLRAVEEVLDSPHGLFLLTGPTGSGKSTTLHAAIRRLQEKREYNILTVEDPIEYEIDGVNQSEVDSADKVNFVKALRSLLRHDPDIIMIGEIRDEESLDVAVKAALTGHLVLTTLHTNSATGAVTRLGDMGLAGQLTAATLRMSMAQRLVRRLCPHCREETALGRADAALLGDAALEGRRVWTAGGCLACAGRGYAGRTALFELFRPDAAAAADIAAGRSEAEMLAGLLARGHRTLAADAREKVLDGTTSMDEVRRVL